MRRKRVALVRGKYFNRFEMQSYEQLTAKYDIVGFTSYSPIHNAFSFPIHKLPSPVDLVSILARFGISPRISMGVFNRIFVDAHVLFGLESQLQGFDIVHTAETYMYFTHQALRARGQDRVKKVVTTVWETIPGNNEGIRGRKKNKQQVLDQVDHFLATTKRAKRALIQEGCNPKKISVIYPGVDHSCFIPKKMHKNAVSKLLFVGRLEKEKGVWEIFHAFAKLVHKYPKLRLEFVGSGSQKRALKTIIKNKGLSSKINIRNASYEDLPQIYREADIFVLASKRTNHWEEQFGMVLIEAMASGVPIVATKCGSIPEVVGNAGVLCESKDLEQAIEGLVLSYSKRALLARVGRARVKKLFNATKTSKKIARVYSRLT